MKSLFAHSLLPSLGMGSNEYYHDGCIKGLPYQNNPSPNPVDNSPCIREPTHQSTPPLLPTDNLTIQLIEFTYTNDRFSQDIINKKIHKYQPLINDITQQGWKVDPLLVIAAGARGTTHIPSKEQLEKTFKLSETSINHAFKEINTIALQYANSILLHKRRIENNQSIPIE